MKITTLGTSHGDSTFNRFNSSTLYEFEDALYLIDCGAPCEGLLRRAGKNFAKIRAIFVTHMHNDHVGGLTELYKEMIKYAKPGQHTTVYLPEDTADAFFVWAAAMHLPKRDDVFTFKVVKPGEIYRDENITVEAYPTDHIPSAPVKPVTFAYILSYEGKRLLHTGDLWVDFHDYPKILLEEHFDVLVCECTHFKAEVAVPLFVNTKADKMIFIHVANRWHGTAGEMDFYQAYKPIPVPFLLAHDGDVFEV